jgi:flagellar assembly factor FliW
MTAAPALQPADRAAVTVASRLFGPLSVRPEAFLTFPNGMPGFGGERRFVLLPAASAGVYWLQSADEGSMAFLLVDPFPIFPCYAVELPEVQPVDIPPLVLAVVTLPRSDGDGCTANLQAPLVLDLVRRTGRQLIVGDAGYGPKHPFDLRARLAG